MSPVATMTSNFTAGSQSIRSATIQVMLLLCSSAASRLLTATDVSDRSTPTTSLRGYTLATMLVSMVPQPATRIRKGRRALSEDHLDLNGVSHFGSILPHSQR